MSDRPIVTQGGETMTDHEQNTDSYHVSRFGCLASRTLRPDLDGYVHLTEQAIVDGRWDTGIEDNLAPTQVDEILAANLRGTEECEAEMALFRERERDWQTYCSIGTLR